MTVNNRFDRYQMCTHRVTVLNSITLVKFSEGNERCFAFSSSPVTVIHLGISTRPTMPVSIILLIA